MKMIRSLRIVAVLSAFCACGLLTAQQEPVRQPKMFYADISRRGTPFAKDPSVIQFGGRFLMYYTKGGAIGIAESRDLVNWTKAGEIMPEQAAEQGSIAAPGARVIRGKVHLFYQSYGRERQNGLSSTNAICHAISDDGIHFVHDPSNPIFHPAPSSWSVGRAIDAEVLLVPEKNKAYLYYATRDPEMRRQMLGMAEAPLDSDFSAKTWHEVNIGGPILEPVEPWEQLCIEAPSAVRHGNSFYLFYAGAYNNMPQQIGVARSKDGIHWTRLSSQPFLVNGEPGSWNSSESGHPGVLQVGKKTYLFYQGNNDQGKTYHLSIIPILWHGDTPVPDRSWDAPHKAK